jgi:hypothetical protein
MSRRGLTAALLAALGAACAAPPVAGAAGDPALEALRGRDAFASPRALGAAAAQAEARLAETAASLRAKDHPVKLAVVLGPSGAPSMRAYVRRMRRALDFRGTLVATAPGRAVVAIGPRPPAEITRDLRSGAVGRIADPVDRVVRAAELAVGTEAGNGSGSATRGLTALLALAVAGGAWAAAWGLRREKRRSGSALAAERARVRVELDALRARARDLASRPHPPPGAREELDRALASYSEGLVQLERSRRAEDARRAIVPLGDGLASLRRAAEALGEPLDPDRPYDGLCAVDPGHGPATTTVVPADEEDPVPACAHCVEEAVAGRPPHRRVVPFGGHDVPFDEAPRASALVASAYDTDRAR